MKKHLFILFILSLFFITACDKVEETYYVNGQLHEKKIYKSDNHIIYKEYYENGTLKSKVNFINGKQNGILKSYFPNGKLQTISEFSDGKQNGVFKEFFINGKLAMYATLENDTTTYYQEFDSLGNKIESYRLIKVIPEKYKYEIGDTYKAKIIISGPKNYKTSKLVVCIVPFIDSRSKDFKNVSVVNYVADQPFKKKMQYWFCVNVWCDTAKYNVNYWIDIK